METNNIIVEANLVTNNKLSSEVLEKFCLIIITSLINKFGSKAVEFGVNTEKNNEVNNILTHVVEIGSIKLMSDSSLIISDEDALLARSFATVFLMNIALGNMLRYKGLLKTQNSGLYGGPALETIAGRVFNLGKTHNSYDSLPKKLKDDTFTTDELFAFYLGDYFK
jgi:hypothetical protein